MRIKMLRTPGVLRGEEQRLLEGREYDLPDAEAKILVEGLMAEPVGSATTGPAEPEPEPKKARRGKPAE